MYTPNIDHMTGTAWRAEQAEHELTTIVITPMHVSCVLCAIVIGIYLTCF